MRKNKSLLILSQNIRRLRKEKGLTQAQLAEKIDKTVEMVCQLENGLVSTKISTLDAIADTLGVDVYQLFMDREALLYDRFTPELTDLFLDLQDQSPEYVKALTSFLKMTQVQNKDQ